MLFLITITGMELLVHMVEPLRLVFVDHMEFPNDVSETWAQQITGYSLIVTSMAALTAAWHDVREGDLINHLAYLMGMGLLLSHLSRNISDYDQLYVVLGGHGSVMSEVIVLLVFLLLPVGAMLVPVLSLPFEAIAEERYMARVRRYFGGE